ncbi:MAG: LEPR-XLL domain-containing protein [Chitinophagales bacterium]|nr:LEPR-XLL domain-containing protein [Chitinophagales bacterium]
MEQRILLSTDLATLIL